ncbi:MAG: hypothetical protein RLZZ546_2598 [Bacteroidota bacterium]|jgi:predicted NAD-dependent protein-ADP-ribosyltransferase YbiA (DUF1768 family)
MSNLDYIAFTKVALPFGWLGNMSAYPIQYKGREWRNTEALFQAMRFEDKEIQELIRAEKSPMGAKLKSKGLAEHMTVTQLSDEDVENMRLCVKLKLEQYPNLLRLLLDTGEIPIYEDVTKRGDQGSNLFWGAKLVDNQWIGKNVLGNIWMDFRKEYRDGKSI